jgi:hypothetical protein
MASPTLDATAVLANMRRLADGALALEAYLNQPDARPGRDSDLQAIRPSALSHVQSDTRTLADQLDAALAELAGAARELRRPRALPPLRETQQALASRIGASAPLAEETDRIVNSIGVTARVLERASASPAPAQPS